MKDFNAKSKNAYNKKADSYDNSLDGKFTEAFKNFLLEKIILQEGDRVLDVACGNGTLLNMMSKKKDIKGFGIDISDQMIKNAVSRNSNMHFRVAGCENIPLENNSIDIITVCAAFHHFPDVTAFAKEADRLIKCGGQLYIAEIYLPSLLRVICNPFVPLSKDGDVKFYSSKEIQHIFEAYGFELNHVYKKENIQIINFRKI